MLVYLDTSALVKLVVVEVETPQLMDWLAGFPDLSLTSSSLARTELVRAVRQHGQENVAKARLLIDGIALVMPDDELLTAAGHIAPPMLRSLDALHIASAQRLGPTLKGIVTYDKRMIEAARAAGFSVHHPGR